MSKQIIIELTKQVTEELNEREYKLIDYLHTPFTKFILKFPMNVYLTKEQMLHDLEEKSGKVDPIKNFEALKFIDTYLNHNLSLSVKIFDGLLEAKLVDMNSKTIFKLHMLSILPLPFVDENSFSLNPNTTAVGLIRLIGNVLDYISSPTVGLRYTSIKEEKGNSGKKSKSGKGNKKTYIYKQVYKINSIVDEYEPKREYNRHAGSWAVRGYWRTYKSGKKIWIKEQTRGRGKKDSKEFKITKLED